jgi:sulfide:quinone oxidoreductase
MVETRKLTDNVSVAGQITAAEVADLARAGFRSIVCNRPDGEAAGQPPFAEIDDAARAVGLVSAYIPVFHGQPMDAAINRMAAAYPDLPKPMLLYCRSGARSTTLIQSIQQRGANI